MKKVPKWRMLSSQKLRFNGHRFRHWRTTIHVRRRPRSKDEPCARCGYKTLFAGQDHCLGRLPLIRQACCGHGGMGYLVTVSDVTYRFGALSPHLVRLAARRIAAGKTPMRKIRRILH